jgi:hypothetical protein
MVVTETPVSRQSEEPAIRFRRRPMPDFSLAARTPGEPDNMGGYACCQDFGTKCHALARAPVCPIRIDTPHISGLGACSIDAGKVCATQTGPEVEKTSTLCLLPFPVFEMYYPRTEFTARSLFLRIRVAARGMVSG